MRNAAWTNPSVHLMAGAGDPVEAIALRARRVVLDALDAGWSGPPFDPFALADIMKVEVAASSDVRDARIAPIGESGGFRVEYNPSRPRGRVRYSVAHELAHTLFPDCKEMVRYRASREELVADEWELEALCNVAAAEFLMPIGSFPRLGEESTSIEHLSELRRSFDVSMEALLIRTARLAEHSLAAFAASPIESDNRRVRYRVEYVVPSMWWTESAEAGVVLDADTVPAQCSAIGFTAVGSDRWRGWSHSHRVECLGIPPHPGSTRPRVAGVVLDTTEAGDLPRLEYVRGDATEPRSRPAVVAQIVNNRTANWGGGGFAQTVSRTWHGVQADFQDWAAGGLRLGEVRTALAEPDLWVASMIAQSGYGPSPRPRIRYAALRDALARVSQFAIDHRATLHIPRIGTGAAGGDWVIVEELLKFECLRAGLPVVVYDLPGALIPEADQASLPLDL